MLQFVVCSFVWVFMEISVLRILECDAEAGLGVGPMVPLVKYYRTSRILDPPSTAI